MIGARRAAVGVFLLALAARLFLVLHSGGFLGDYGYDGPVYYTASESLLHGRVPYRDFVLIHPPGIMLALAPFAQLGRLTTDHTGFVTANVIFLILGAVNAALVVAVARRMGLSIRAAAAGGAFYALWSGSTGAEYLVRLEPLGNFLLLLGLFAFFTSRRTDDWRWPALSRARVRRGGRGQDLVEPAAGHRAALADGGDAVAPGSGSEGGRRGHRARG